MSNAETVLKEIKDKDVKFVDLRFTDPRGKLQHLTMDVAIVDEDMFADGVMFDGSSIAGWKAINESDMTLMPDPETFHMDAFYAQTTMAIFCDILEPSTGEGLRARSAHDRKKCRSLPETVRHRRQDLLRTPKPSSSSSMMSATTQIPTTPASSLIRPNCRSTPAPNTKWATWATVRKPRAATFR